MEEKYAVFNFDGEIILVKYICTKEIITKDDIDDCATSYYDSVAYCEDSSYEEMVADIMNSFDGVEYEILNYSFFDME